MCNFLANKIIRQSIVGREKKINQIDPIFGISVIENVMKLDCFLCGEQRHKVFNCHKNPKSASCIPENETSLQDHLLICEDAKTENINQKQYL